MRASVTTSLLWSLPPIADQTLSIVREISVADGSSVQVKGRLFFFNGNLNQFEKTFLKVKK
jgi:hypothetical protein